MDRILTSSTYRKAETQEELLARYAYLMRRRYGATLYLFGSRARGTARPDSDYDLVAVSKAFQLHKRSARVLDRWTLWLEAGGWGRGLDLHCLTPEEFHEETRYGWGYLGGSKKRGELMRIMVGSARRERSARNGS